MPEESRQSQKMTADEVRELIDRYHREGRYEELSQLINRLRKGEIEIVLVDSNQPGNVEPYRPASNQPGNVEPYRPASNQPGNVEPSIYNGPTIPTWLLMMLSSTGRNAVVEHLRTLAEERATELIAAGNIRQARQASELLTTVFTDPILSQLVYSQLQLTPDEFNRLPPGERINRVAYALAMITQFNLAVQGYEEGLNKQMGMKVALQLAISRAQQLQELLPQIQQAIQQMEEAEVVLQRFIEQEERYNQLESQRREAEIRAKIAPAMATVEGVVSSTVGGIITGISGVFVRAADSVGRLGARYPVPFFSSLLGFSAYLYVALSQPELYSRIKAISPYDWVNAPAAAFLIAAVATCVYHYLFNKKD